MPGRNWSASTYRYSHNGQEKQNEIFTGALSAEFWMYDARIGRRWERDPITYEGQSPYATFNDNPIYYSDPSGLEAGEGEGEGGGDGGNKAKTPAPAQPPANAKHGDTWTHTDKDGNTWNYKYDQEAGWVGQGRSDAAELDEVVISAPNPKSTNPNTVGKNRFGSIYMGTEGNPKHYDGTDSYEPKPQDEPDDAARTHDMESGGIGSRSPANIAADFRFILSTTKTVAKKVENETVIPLIGANPNKDKITGQPVSAESTKRAAAGATAIAVVTAAKIALAVTVDPALKGASAVKEGLSKFANDVKTKTQEGLQSIQNWGQ